MKTIDNELNDKIMAIISERIEEGVSGRLFLPTAYTKKVAKLLGLDYDTMGKYKRAYLRQEIVSAAQMGHIKIHSPHLLY